MILVLLAVSILLPLWYAVRLWRLDEPSRGRWLAALAEAALVVALILVLARWDIAGLHTRWVLLALVAAGAARSWRRHAGRPWRAPGPPLWPRLVSLAAVAALAAWVATGLVPPARPLALALPLDHPRVVVGQGGGIALLNYHATHPEQRHAADLTAVGPAGFRVAGLLPADPARYAIWQAPVVAPCGGTVVEVRGDLPDLPPPRADPANPAGNHVALDCGGARVLLAHLREGSVAVGLGDTVAAGQPIARVGNSGNTTEPHLHIHAFDPVTGLGVPIALDGRTPLRNRVWR